uniref:Uncharacterized protein n=1 Tax=Sphaerodactylus townsendi TaxID=933632 RepID=A0ACB8F6N9_9SAUR
MLANPSTWEFPSFINSCCPQRGRTQYINSFILLRVKTDRTNLFYKIIPASASSHHWAREAVSKTPLCILGIKTEQFGTEYSRKENNNSNNMVVLNPLHTKGTFLHVPLPEKEPCNILKTL